MSGQGDGSIRIEECPSHKEVVWNFNYSQYNSYSPVFAIGSQDFQLTSSLRFVGCRQYLYIGLQWREPGMYPDCVVQLWAGFKRHDGAYYHANETGRFDLRKKSPYSEEYFKYYWLSELLAQHMSSDGRMTVFLRFNGKQASPAAEACIHGANVLSTWGDGSVKEKACSFHNEVQWTVHYELSRKQFFYFVSPEFETGNQRYRLELTWTRYSYIELNLYRSGPSVKGSEGSIEWWAGLKRADGSYYHRNENGALDLRVECELSKKVETLMYVRMSQVEMLHLGQEENLTVFLILSGKRSKAAAEICVHGATNMLGRSDGVIREKECPSHKDIEWNVHCGLEVDGVQNLASPIFTFGDQHYRLELSSIKEVCLSLCLFRMGPPVKGADGSILWWAGLKLADGTYYARFESRKLELKQNCEIWTEVESLKTVSLSELDDEHLELDGCITFFLRLSWEKLLTSSNTCKHDASEVCARRGVSFREVVYPAHKQVEWDVDYEPKSRDCSLTSPLFVILGQRYVFQFRCSGDVWELHLLKSPCVDSTPGSSVRYWAGLKCVDGTYNHRIESGKLDLSEECETWSNVACLKRIGRGEVEREHLAQNGRVTFFFRTNSRPSWNSPESRTHGVAIVPSRSEGTLKYEECFSYSHLEWNVDRPQERRSVTSPEFAVKNQSYMLELSFDTDTVSLHLYRKGPSCKPDLKKVRCWAGLMRSDESYYYRCLRGKLDLRKGFKTWTEVKMLFSYTSREVERRLITPCGTLKAFFRLTFTGSSEAFLGSSSSEGDGSIREDRTDFTAVEWTVTPEKGSVPASPEFTFEEQRFLFELNPAARGYADLTLYRYGPTCGGCVRWWAGLKRVDGSYYHKTESAELHLSKDYELWRKAIVLKRVHPSELEAPHLVQDGNLTFFILLSGTTAELSIPGTAELSTKGFGTIREEECSTHKEVEWDIRGAPECNFWTLASPEFEIGKQRYLLELNKVPFPVFYLKLYRMGTSVKVPAGSVRFWAGLKKPEGAHCLKNEKGILDLEDHCGMWKEVKCLYKIFGTDLEEEGFTESHRMTFFFRLSLERLEAGSEVCTHVSANLHAHRDGKIREQLCASHYYVEWELKWEKRRYYWSFKSPSFKIGSQLYALELGRKMFGIELRLFRMGPTAGGSVRWWIGMNRGDGIYGYRNENGEFDLDEECELWRKVEQFAVVVYKFNLDFENLEQGTRVTVFFWMSLLRSLASLDTCIHEATMRSVPRTGSLLLAEASSSYKQLVWDIGCAPTGHVTSPDFSMGTQHYRMDFGHTGEVRVFRMGLAVDGPIATARWFIGAEYWNDTYDQYESDCGELDLKGACELWTEVKSSYLRKVRSGKTVRLKIFCLLSLETEQTSAVAGDAGTEVPPNVEPTLRENVVFKVQGKEFKVHRAILRIRVPALEAMFRYDTVENRSGVANIDDCDPDAFEKFLQFVETGELQATTAYDLLAVYAVADKYLMEPLKFECVCQLRNTLSVDNFSDVVELIVVHEYHDMFEQVTSFLFEYKRSIIPSDAWQNFKIKYPEAAHRFEPEAVV